MTIKPSSLEYVCSENPTKPNDFLFSNGLKVQGRECLTVLGESVAADGATMPAANYRLGKADGAFYAIRDALICRSAPIKDRFELYNERIVSVAIFGCEGWSWSKGLSPSFNKPKTNGFGKL